MASDIFLDLVTVPFAYNQLLFLHMHSTVLGELKPAPQFPYMAGCTCPARRIRVTGDARF